MPASLVLEAHAISTAKTTFSAISGGGSTFCILRTAWISHSLARALDLPWVVRYEDIDKPRVLNGARDAQAADLHALGLRADFELLQSDFEDRHWSLFEKAVASGQVYPCDCSRRDVQFAIASAPHDGVAPIYSGRCRTFPTTRNFAASETIAWRFRSAPESGSEDFIVARSQPTLINGRPDRVGFVPAYHWACAIDDYDGGYDILVRSLDLLPAARVQRSIHSWLSSIEIARAVPRLFHTSLVVDNSGHRLEKRTRGVKLSELVSLGITPADLVARFERSFDNNLLNAQGDVRELAETLTLQNLEL